MTREHRKSEESRAKDKKKNQSMKRQKNQKCTKTLHKILSKHQIKGRLTNRNSR